MSDRTITQLVRALEVTEGAGVNVYRTIGAPALRNLDPFLMLDQFNTDDPQDYIAGFPEHPHRGFSTFTYMLEGHMQHADSMGNRGDLAPGGAQWMKAGSGVIHSEMPQQLSGRMLGFQLWINLPAGQKMSRPDYQDIRPEAIPEHEREHYRVRILAGEYGGQRGPVCDPDTGAQILDLALTAGGTFTHTLPPDHTAFLYLFEGDAAVADTATPAQHLAVLSSGERLSIRSDRGGRLLLVSGAPIREPILQYGPFVMNTREEIEQAFADLRDGRLVRTE